MVGERLGPPSDRRRVCFIFLRRAADPTIKLTLRNCHQLGGILCIEAFTLHSTGSLRPRVGSSTVPPRA